MKINIAVIHAAILVLLFGVPAPAVETGSLSCGNGIVSIGDTAVEVLGKCGQPAYKTQREDKIVEEAKDGSRNKKIISASIDDWLFNFGPNQFQYRVLLENGRVSRIESLDYGF